MGIKHTTHDRVKGDAITSALWNAEHEAILVADIDSNEFNAANKLVKLDADAKTPLAQIPVILTGKDADTIDGIEGAEIFKKDGSVAMTGDLLPDTDNSRLLGASGKRWSHLVVKYLTGLDDIRVSVDLLPSGNETKLLGNATLRWLDIYAVNAHFDNYNLIAGDIPDLAASKITSGEFALARIPTPLTGKDADSVDGCDAGVATGNVFKVPAGITQGDIFYVDATANIVRLAAGTSGYFLKTQGAAANPVWGAGIGVFTGLTDTPGAYTGHGGKLVKVNATPDALEFGILESDIFKKDGSVAMTGDASFNAYDIGWKFGAQTNSPRLFSVLGSPYELFCKPSGGDSMGELGIMPSGTNTQSALVLWNSNDYDNGGFAFFRIGGTNEVIIDPSYHGTGVAPTLLRIKFDTVPYSTCDQKLGDASHYWSDIYVVNIRFGGSQGDVLFIDSAGIVEKLSPGTDGYQLTTHGVSADPTWAAASDLLFSEQECAKCGKKFKVGENIILKIIEFNEVGDTVTIPIHSDCAKQSMNTIIVKRKVKEDYWIWDEEKGEAVMQKRNKTIKKLVTKKKIKAGYELDPQTKKFWKMKKQADKMTREKMVSKIEAIEGVEEEIEEVVYEDKEFVI